MLRWLCKHIEMGWPHLLSWARCWCTAHCCQHGALLLSAWHVLMRIPDIVQPPGHHCPLQSALFVLSCCHCHCCRQEPTTVTPWMLTAVYIHAIVAVWFMLCARRHCCAWLFMEAQLWACVWSQKHCHAAGAFNIAYVTAAVAH